MKARGPRAELSCTMGLLDQLSNLFGGSKKSARPASAQTPRADRHKTVGFSCRLGQVLDMSSSGMRVQMDEKPDLTTGRVLEISVASPLQRCSLKMRVAWIRKMHEGWHVGFQFIDVGPAMAESLDSLARYGCANLQDPGARRGRSSADERAAREREYAARKAGSPEGLEATVHCTDLYALLDVPSEADEAEIKSAYRRAVRILHPDVNKTPEAAEQFAMVRTAYTILTDPAKRARYDTLRRKAA